MRAVLLAGALLLPVLAGCLAPQPTEPAGVVEDLLAPFKILEARGFEIEVPVHVLLLGFEPGVGPALAENLGSVRLEHEVLNIAREFPPGPESSLEPSPTVPIAKYAIHEGDAATTAAFLEAAASAPVEDGLYDGNFAENWLAANLPATGFPVDPAFPALVLVHAGDALGEHAWRYAYPGGHLDGVRAFGERTPLLVFDVSAKEDPYVVTTGALQSPSLPLPVAVPQIGAAIGQANTALPPQAVEREPYNYPLGPGLADLEALTLLVTDATHFRLLQSSVYPIATKACHAVTLILAIRATSVSEYIGLGAEQYVDVEGLRGGFLNLTGGDNVFVDFKVLRLPVDDPVLDLMIPRHPEMLDTFRWWLDTNWDKYWVAHDGCEPYVSFLVSGDHTENLGFGGVAMYGVEETHRISFSAVTDHHRIRETYDGPGSDTINNRPRSIVAYDRINRLFSHETGHLIGQHHPHNVARTDDGTRTTPAFSAVWSSMSYQNRERMIDFGTVDQANFQRNRAGFVIQAAMHEGLERTAEFEAAVALLRDYKFREASNLLIPLLEADHDEACAGRC